MRALPGTVLLCLCAARLIAQEPWKASYYPYPLKGPDDKLALVLHYQYSQAAEYDDTVPFAGSLSLEAGANADGSRFFLGRFKGPRLLSGWRFNAEVGSRRENRFRYHGLGNDAMEVPAGPPVGAAYGARVRRLRHVARADLTRQLAGRLHLAVGAGWASTTFSPLPGPSRFRADYVPADPGDRVGAFPDPARAVSDLTARAHLVFDTRDREDVPSRGVFLEAGVLAGSAGEGYTGAYGIARGYVMLREGSVIAGRILGRTLETEAPLDARATVAGWEREVPVLGGPDSHRSFGYGRFLGREVVLMNVEYRQDILNFGDFGAIVALAFVDAGRVREGLPEESRDLHIGGGAGLSLRILRSTILTFNFAGGPDGYQFSMGTGWAF